MSHFMTKVSKLDILWYNISH